MATAHQLFLRSLADKHGNRCAYCGCSFDCMTITADHVNPLSKGGSRASGNIVPACRDCNLAKADSSVKQFRLAIICQHYARLCGRFFAGMHWKRLVQKFGPGPVVFPFEASPAKDPTP